MIIKAEGAAKAHADRKRGKGGHKEGAPDSCMFVAVLMGLLPLATNDEQNAIKSWLGAHPPSRNAIAKSVRCCRVEKTHHAEFKRFFNKLDAEDVQLEWLVQKLIEKKGAVLLFGQALRGRRWSGRRRTC